MDWTVEAGGSDAGTIPAESIGGAMTVSSVTAAAGASVTSPAAGGASSTTTAPTAGGSSFGGTVATGGTTLRATTGGATAVGGATYTATTTAPECRFLSPQRDGIKDLGPCSVYSRGQYHCEAGKCVSGNSRLLDCDHDGTAETDGWSLENCGACGNSCAEIDGAKCVKPETTAVYAWYECRV
jgi:hypothetical protein